MEKSSVVKRVVFVEIDNPLRPEDRDDHEGKIVSRFYAPQGHKWPMWCISIWDLRRINMGISIEVNGRKSCTDRWYGQDGFPVELISRVKECLEEAEKILVSNQKTNE